MQDRVFQANQAPGIWFLDRDCKLPHDDGHAIDLAGVNREGTVVLANVMMANKFGPMRLDGRRSGRKFAIEYLPRYFEPDGCPEPELGERLQVAAAQKQALGLLDSRCPTPQLDQPAIALLIVVTDRQESSHDDLARIGELLAQWGARATGAPRSPPRRQAAPRRLSI